MKRTTISEYRMTGMIGQCGIRTVYLREQGLLGGRTTRRRLLLPEPLQRTEDPDRRDGALP